MKFKGSTNHPDVRWVRGVKALETGAAKQAVVNNGALENQANIGAGIYSSSPPASAGAVKVLGMLS
jgi:hypothetical protein